MSEVKKKKSLKKNQTQYLNLIVVLDFFLGWEIEKYIGRGQKVQ
jgi:hypothetical protein